MRSRQEIIDLLVEVRTVIRADRKKETKHLHLVYLALLRKQEREVKVAIGTLYGFTGTPQEANEVLLRLPYDVKMRMTSLSLGKESDEMRKESKL